jgi:hypothetical protein
MERSLTTFGVVGKSIECFSSDSSVSSALHAGGIANHERELRIGEKSYSLDHLDLVLTKGRPILGATDPGLVRRVPARHFRGTLLGVPGRKAAAAGLYRAVQFGPRRKASGRGSMESRDQATTAIA